MQHMPAAVLLFAVLASAQSPGFWEARPSLAIARQELAAAVLDGEVWAAGGLGITGAALASVERYDPQSGAWSVAGALPTTLHHFGMAAAGGRLYAVGGYEQSFTGVARCYRFDPSAQAWSRIADLPQPRGALAAVEIGGLVYAVGGVVPGRGVVGDLTVYDPATNSWRTLAPMPTAREHLAAAAIDGRLYVAGGRRGMLFAALERYDPATDRWSALTPMPTARGGNGAAVLDGKLVVVGGEGSSLPGGTFPQAEEYDPATDSWRSLAEMAVPLHGIYPVALGDELFVAGGATRAGFGATSIALALRRLPSGTTRYGSATPACRGRIEAFPTAQPLEGSPLAIACSPHAPATTAGGLLLGTAPDLAGTAFAGVALHVALLPPWILVPAATDPSGAAAVPLLLPPGTAGAVLYAQLLWVNTPSCRGAGALSGTDALAVTVKAGLGRSAAYAGPLR